MTPQDRDLVAQLCAARAGLLIDPDKAYLLENRLSPIARREGFASVHDLICAVRDRDDERLAWGLIEAMSPAETGFFRDPDVFAWIVETLLPNLARPADGGPLRLWSATCGAGQEIYSLAMALEEALPVGVAVEVFASDLSERRLEKAQAGVYSAFEVQRGLSAHRLVRHFEGRDENFALSPRVRQLVRWRRANLMDDPARLGQFDVVLCRNLLSHLTEAGRSQVLGNLQRTLRPGGWLVLGGRETAPGLAAHPDLPGVYGPPSGVQVIAA